MRQELAFAEAADSCEDGRELAQEHRKQLESKQTANLRVTRSNLSPLHQTPHPLTPPPIAMSLSAFARTARAARLSSTPSYRLRPAALANRTFVSSRISRMPAGDPHDPHHEESFEEFTAR